MKIGIIGSGQLGRMLALAGLPLGLDFVFYTSDPTHKNVLGTCICAAEQDWVALKDFAQQVDVITYENENIAHTILDYLHTWTPVYPNRQALISMQDRLSEKKAFEALGIPTNAYDPIDDKGALFDCYQRHKTTLILKKRTHSYDGKGQVWIRSQEDIHPLTDADCHQCIAEHCVSFDREVSLIGCRNPKGDMVFYDLCENVHQQGILRHTRNQPHDPAWAQARTYLSHFMQSMDYVGVCTLEFFEKDQQLLANESAPRVHNSGHWTIEGAQTSQFENHLRGILNWPLGSCQSRGCFLMGNLLGHIPDKTTLLQYPDVKLHDYQKTPKAGRKLGHITLPYGSPHAPLLIPTCIMKTP